MEFLEGETFCRVWIWMSDAARDGEIEPNSVRFCVEDWMACGPGLETREDWKAWSRGVRNSTK